MPGLTLIWLWWGCPETSGVPSFVLELSAGGRPAAHRRCQSWTCYGRVQAQLKLTELCGRHLCLQQAAQSTPKGLPMLFSGEIPTAQPVCLQEAQETGGSLPPPAGLDLLASPRAIVQGSGLSYVADPSPGTVPTV